MSRILVMPIEGILRKEVGGQLNPEGYHLYRALSAMYRIILVTYETNHQRVTSWLEQENILVYDDILYGDMCINTLESYWENMIRILRMRGYNVSLVVVNGPQEAREVANTHVPVLMYTQPAYALPEWLPGSRKGAEAWDALVDKIETERSARISDKRMEAHLE